MAISDCISCVSCSSPWSLLLASVRGRVNVCTDPYRHFFLPVFSYATAPLNSKQQVSLLKNCRRGETRASCCPEWEESWGYETPEFWQDTFRRPGGRAEWVCECVRVYVCVRKKEGSLSATPCDGAAVILNKCTLWWQENISPGKEAGSKGLFCCCNTLLSSSSFTRLIRTSDGHSDCFTPEGWSSGVHRRSHIWVWFSYSLAGLTRCDLETGSNASIAFYHPLLDLCNFIGEVFNEGMETKVIFTCVTQVHC